MPAPSLPILCCVSFSTQLLVDFALCTDPIHDSLTCSSFDARGLSASIIAKSMDAAAIQETEESWKFE